MPGYKLSEFHPLAAERYVVRRSRSPLRRRQRAVEDLAELIEWTTAELPAIASSAAGRARPVRRGCTGATTCSLETAFDSGIDAVADLWRTGEKVDLTLTARQVMHPMEGRGLLCWWDYRAAWPSC